MKNNTVIELSGRDTSLDALIELLEKSGEDVRKGQKGLSQSHAAEEFSQVKVQWVIAIEFFKNVCFTHSDAFNFSNNFWIGFDFQASLKNLDGIFT
ncbi:MAG TPA: hypothetical protein VKN62_10655, partial [Pelovirga sp.]|nr:hypothetical protein [Pelovirga sp.]